MLKHQLIVQSGRQHRSQMSNNNLKAYLEEIADILAADFPSAYRAQAFTKGTMYDMPLNLILYGDPLLIPGNWNLLDVDYYAGYDFTADIAQKLTFAASNYDAIYYLIPRAFQAEGGDWAVLTQAQLIKRTRQAIQFFSISHPKLFLYVLLSGEPLLSFKGIVLKV